MKTNPFRFGTVVDGEYFTDREEEQQKIKSYISSENHLVIISPRRYGKTSLMRKIVNESGRKYVFLDLQVVLSADDFAAQLLKRIYRIFPVQKLKGYIKSFRIIPVLNINPVTGEAEITFRPGSGELTPLEDVLNLLEKLGTGKNKIIVVLDEFQEVFRIRSGLDRFLRSVMQNHRNINYVFMGSSESMIREIFEKRSSPFFRFSTLLPLEKISSENFSIFLESRFIDYPDKKKIISKEILEITSSHPYYTQQLAFIVWEQLARNGYSSDTVKKAAEEIVQSHDNDYERLWSTLNRTDMGVLTGMAMSNISPLSEEFSRTYGTGAPSTVFSTLQRLARKGMITKEQSGYIIDDPFFGMWIIGRRNA